VSTRCGIVGADARPHWREQPARETLTGMAVNGSMSANLGYFRSRWETRDRRHHSAHGTGGANINRR